jgi:hypothetical protein
VAFQAGRQTAVLCGGYDISGYLRTAQLSLSWNLADTTTFGSVGRTRIATTNTAALTTTGVWDPTQDSIINATSGVDGTVVTYCPIGAGAVGNRAWLLYGASTTYTPTSEYDDAVTFAWDAESEALTVAGQVLHTLSEDTNTTTGSGKDDTAATSTGWTAWLHVTLVDGGSWVVKLEDSADNSNWSDVSGGAFTAATGVTSQRLTSAAGATLRRYVRCTATRTGGSAGQGITYALLYGRTV